MFKKNLKKDLFFYQRGWIKEVIVVIAIIFVLAYFNVNPQEAWKSIVDLYNFIVN